MKVAGIAFEETVISLDAADFKAQVGAVSGTGKVPVLIDGDVQVWESLAILEYLAEKFSEPKACGRLKPPPGRTPAPYQTKCTPDSSRCAS